MNNLKEYNEKRNFKKTSEPKGKKQTSKKTLKFVIQHHYASKEHYDLRLEWNGVYKSFAIPKGPSYNPKDKRLAIKVEDHPLSYGNFEGTIPKGEYGGGTVILWDKGSYTPLEGYKPNFKKGPIKFFLKGKRLYGAWSLVNFQNDNWLLIKEKDKYVQKVDITKYKNSIKTGKRKKEIESGITPIKDIKITNPNKIIYDKGKITKIDIINYYSAINQRMMPYLENRLISTVRAPNGIKGEKFFMKHLNTKSKDIGKKMIKDTDSENKDYYYIKNINGLLSEVQMNSYEFHIWGSNISAINKPDIIVFDLDPDEKLSLKKLREGVMDLKNILDKLKLKSFLKTSGGKGYHIVVPIELKSFKEAEEISKSIAKIMVEKFPNKYTINIRKEARKGKIFIDYLRNKKSATSVCPYSLRLKENAPISFPISWKNLSEIAPNEITIKNYKNYIKGYNPWKNFFKANK